VPAAAGEITTKYIGRTTPSVRRVDGISKPLLSCPSPRWQHFPASG